MSKERVVIPSLAAAVAALVGVPAPDAKASVETNSDAKPTLGQSQPTFMSSLRTKPVGDDLMLFTIGEHKDGKIVADHASHSSHSSHASHSSSR